MIDDEREKRKTGQEKGIGNARTLGKIYCAEAAKAVKVGEATLYRWLREEDFQKDYRSLKQEILGHSITRLQKASSLAVDALVEIVKDKEKPSSVRVMSARSILDFSNKGVEIETLEESILNLEKIIKMRG